MSSSRKRRKRRNSQRVDEDAAKPSRSIDLMTNASQPRKKRKQGLSNPMDEYSNEVDRAVDVRTNMAPKCKKRKEDHPHSGDTHRSVIDPRLLAENPITQACNTGQQTYPDTGNEHKNEVHVNIDAKIDMFMPTSNLSIDRADTAYYTNKLPTGANANRPGKAIDTNETAISFDISRFNKTIVGNKLIAAPNFDIQSTAFEPVIDNTIRDPNLFPNRTSRTDALYTIDNSEANFPTQHYFEEAWGDNYFFS